MRSSEARSKSRKLKRVPGRRGPLIAVLLMVLAGLVTWYYVFSRFGPAREMFVDIPQGVGTRGIALRLQQAGVIRSARVFEVYRALHGGTLRAGEYRFDHPVTLADVYARVVRGDVYTIKLVVPEGYDIFDIARAAQAAGLAKASDFLLAEQTDTALIADLDPQAKSLEGFLFPDTYRFSRHATAEQILAAMVKRFRQKAAALSLRSGPSLGRTVILASLIEKEVKVDAERPVVGGVFINRLAQGVPLATDPSVIYAAMLEGRWRGTIYQSDLHSASAYNTYKYPGLPPGPIANPGVAALQAAMHPAKTDYFYFVADAQGHSVFSVSLKQHEEQVQAYRRAQAAQR